MTYRGSEDNIEAVGLRQDGGLTHLNLDDPTSRSHYIIPLNRENTRASSTGAAAPCCTLPHQSVQNEKGARLFGRQRLSGLAEYQGRHRSQDVDLTGQVLANLSSASNT